MASRSSQRALKKRRKRKLTDLVKRMRKILGHHLLCWWEVDKLEKSPRALRSFSEENDTDGEQTS